MPTSNKELIKQINEQFSSEDFYLEDYLAEDIRWNIVGLQAIVGRNNFVKAIDALGLENFPAVFVKNVISEGEYVVVESTGKALSQTGKNYNFSYCDIYHIKNGKIDELTTYIIDVS